MNELVLFIVVVTRLADTNRPCRVLNINVCISNKFAVCWSHSSTRWSASVHKNKKIIDFLQILTNNGILFSEFTDAALFFIPAQIFVFAFIRTLLWFIHAMRYIYLRINIVYSCPECYWPYRVRRNMVLICKQDSFVWKSHDAEIRHDFLKENTVKVIGSIV